MKTIHYFLFAVIGLATMISCTKILPRLTVKDRLVEEALPTDTVTVADIQQETEIPSEDDLQKGKFIYLTIDDSPLNGSRYIDSVVRATKVKTNIFMVGHPIDESSRFKRHYELLKGNPYIDLYNHSYSHANHKYLKYYRKPEEVVADFEKNRTDFNLSHSIARLPGRNLWKIGEKTKNYRQTGSEAAGLLAEKGYKIFGWDVEWKYDSSDNSPLQTIDELIEEIDNLSDCSTTFTKGHIVLLMHDQMFAKINEKNDLKELITQLKKKGYSFNYLTEYPKIPSPDKQDKIKHKSLPALADQ